MEQSTTEVIFTIAGKRWRVVDERVVTVYYVKDGVHLSYSYTAARVERVS